MKTALIMLAATALSGCATQAPLPPGSVTPEQAIYAAAESAPRAVHEVVSLQVKAVGSQHGFTYLNSEEDYRDQRNVSIAISPEVLKAVEAQFGGPLDKVAKGKRVRVEGAAQRVTIWLIDSGGKQTDKYYYQTHIPIVNAAQIQLL